MDSWRKGKPVGHLSALGKVWLGGVVVALLLGGCGGHSRSSVRTEPGQGAARAALHTARTQIGAPYRYGGASPSTGFDCSGLVHWSYLQQGVRLPRTTKQQLRTGREIGRAGLAEGDLVFFQIGGPGALHVGIYAGADTIVHSPKTGGRVREESMQKRYWQERYRTARRVD